MSSRGLFYLVLGVVVLIGAGCARRAERVVLPNLAIPVSCASEITLLGCDVSVNPPKCRNAKVKYREGCEVLVVKR